MLFNRQSSVGRVEHQNASCLNSCILQGSLYLYHRMGIRRPPITSNRLAAESLHFSIIACRPSHPQMLSPLKRLPRLSASDAKPTGYLSNRVRLVDRQVFAAPPWAAKKERKKKQFTSSFHFPPCCHNVTPLAISMLSESL